MSGWLLSLPVVAVVEEDVVETERAQAVVVAVKGSDQDIVAKVVVINHSKLFNRTDRARIRETNADHTMVAATTDHKTWRR